MSDVLAELAELEEALEDVALRIGDARAEERGARFVANEAERDLKRRQKLVDRSTMGTWWRRFYEGQARAAQLRLEGARRKLHEAEAHTTELLEKQSRLENARRHHG